MPGAKGVPAQRISYFYVAASYGSLPSLPTPSPQNAAGTLVKFKAAPPAPSPNPKVPGARVPPAPSPNPNVPGAKGARKVEAANDIGMLFAKPQKHQQLE